MKLGAFDFVKKPFELEELLVTEENARRAAVLERRVAYHHGRERDKLVVERVGLENQLQSLLCLHGICDFRPRLKKAAEKLEAEPAERKPPERPRERKGIGGPCGNCFAHPPAGRNARRQT